MSVRTRLQCAAAPTSVKMAQTVREFVGTCSFTGCCANKDEDGTDYST